MPRPQVNEVLLALFVAVQVAEAAPRDPSPPPEAAFLEFLGSWQTGDNQWVDPFTEDEAAVLGTGDRREEPREREFRDRPKRKQLDPNESSSTKETDPTPSRRIGEP